MSSDQGYRHLKGAEQFDPASLAVAILDAEGTATTEFAKEGLAFQRLALPSMLDAINRLIPKWGTARVLGTLPAFIMPMIVSLVSQVLGALPKENRREFVRRYARDIDAHFRSACARSFAAFDGIDADVMADAEWGRIKAERADPAADRVDAERWRAFLASGRIKLWGWGGFNDAPGDDRGYRHFGGEFWSTYSAENLTAEQEQTRVRLNEQAREILTQYADALRAKQAGP